MERNFNNDFESFLKENADQFRMYPSNRVWKGVHSALHNNRKWYGIGFLLLLITGSLITLLITKSPKQNLLAENKKPITLQQPDHRTNPVTVIFNKPLGFAKTEKAISKNYFTETPQPEITQPDKNSNINFSKANLTINNKIDQPLKNILSAEILKPSPLSIQITDELTDQTFYTNNLNSSKKIAATKPFIPASSNSFNWTIESVLNSYSALKKHKRFGLEFDFTPTVSYRKLSENKTFTGSASQNGAYTYAPLYNINSAVTHKPDMGLELGLIAKYSLNQKLKIKTGLQFNISRYDIKAFDYPLETAKIALDGGTRIEYAISDHRNFNGFSSSWLQNLYFQISVPVGLEVKLAGDDKVQFGIGGTIQPTYVIGDRAYLLSTDYKNYAQVPWLIRRWNANTTFETFVAYSTGKVNWQVGPQIRYQLYSSFINKYPVKENLYDFGLKVGISLSKQ